MQVEDPRGETAEQAVFLTIERKTLSFIDNSSSPTDFVQNGGSICGDHFIINDTSQSPSLFDISGGSGNDLAQIGGTVNDIGIKLGAGADTLWVRPTGVHDVLVYLGEGRDTIELDAHVQTMVVQNFDADDLLILDGGRLTASDGLDVALYGGTTSKVFTSELLAIGALTSDINEVIAYQNGQDSYLLVENGATISTTVKFEDTILTDYSQIIV